MNRLLLTALWVVMTSAHADEAAVLDKDFHTMMAWFPGVYDNQEQVYFEQEQEVEEALRHEPIHHVFEPVYLPAFGEHVFYVQQHLNDDPARYIASAFTPFRARLRRGRHPLPFFPKMGSVEPLKPQVWGAVPRARLGGCVWRGQPIILGAI
ncbi:MAG: hypothetical protein CM15mP103_01410 [Gammaproteobacteria bacterium]|nr:MAG: hypothetical protein CM15mP103_01410 [Gammaproteobacteria bacterium]